jgi:hypothetical protein
VALSPVYANQPTSGVSFAQISFTGAQLPEEYSHYVQVSIDYATLYGDGYINVERYENGKAAGWERNTKLDFVIVSLKGPPQGKTYSPPIRPLVKDIKQNDLVIIPRHPGYTLQTKQGGYYYDITNKKRCYISPSPAMNALSGQVDAKCGAVKGTSGSPLLDATETKGDDTPYAIGLVVGCRPGRQEAPGLQESRGSGRARLFGVMTDPTHFDEEQLAAKLLRVLTLR